MILTPIQPLPPLERESFVRIVESTIPQIYLLSMNKKDENYLFEDYHLKSGIAIWIPNLRTSGRSIWTGVWSETKPHLLNKLDYNPWTSYICDGIAAGFHN
jgi:hypothetical protein